ncbi:sensor histidine kinase [Puia sp. P3]|uniref:sensor histidine kinase n=1 Tax=Puia sp. P3 TaxID=3423952 RepID=UPI003D673FC7
MKPSTVNIDTAQGSIRPVKILSGRMKLLNKSIRQLIQYALIIFAVCVPLFYFIIEQLYIQDVDDALYLKRDELRLRASHLHSQKDIDLWLAMDDDVKVANLAKNPAKDTLYFTQYLDSIPQEVEPYRELVSSIVIGNVSYKLVVRASLVESRDLIIGIAEAQAVLLFLLLIGWILIIRFKSKRAWRPFYTTIDQLRNYELDKGRFPILESSDIREFNDLNNAITELVHRSHQVFSSQKKFIENASHEMQTPLAIFRSKLDNMIESRVMTTEETKDFQVLYEAVQRLHHLNKGLLLLSRIENSQFEETEAISVAELVQKTVAFLQETIESKEIHLQMELPGNPVIRANETLLQVMITNLLINAVQHNHRNGCIIIRLDTARLSIANSGPVFPFAEDDLFTRFKKHSSPQKGVGLGLSIIKEIADKYKLPILYEYTEPNHLFSLYFNHLKSVV